jgi:hypothetical protein
MDLVSLLHPCIVPTNILGRLTENNTLTESQETFRISIKNNEPAPRNKFIHKTAFSIEFYAKCPTKRALIWMCNDALAFDNFYRSPL